MDIECQWVEYPKEGLVKSIKANKKGENYAQLTLTTLQNQPYELVWSPVGLIDKKANKTYETFESFLRQNSPMYTKVFNDSLYRKLQKLQQQTNDDD